MRIDRGMSVGINGSQSSRRIVFQPMVMELEKSREGRLKCQIIEEKRRSTVGARGYRIEFLTKKKGRTPLSALPALLPGPEPGQERTLQVRQGRLTPETGASLLPHLRIQALVGEPAIAGKSADPGGEVGRLPTRRPRPLLGVAAATQDQERLPAHLDCWLVQCRWYLLGNNLR